MLRPLNNILKFRKELHHLYSSPGMFQVINPGRTRWVVNVARIEEMRNSYRVLVGTLEGKIIPG
jgi:hypothetical protein